MAAVWHLLPVVLLLWPARLADAERAKESARAAGGESVALNAKAAGFGHSRKAGHHRGHQKLLELEDVFEKEKNLTAAVGGEHVEKLGKNIASLVQEVGEKMDGALKQSAATALQESKQYEEDVMELHEDLEGFGKNADQLQGDLQTEHKQKVDSIDEVIKNSMTAPDDTRASLLDLGGSDMTDFARAPPSAISMQQAYEPAGYGSPSFVVASQMSGPPPSSAFSLPAPGATDNDEERLLGPENGI